MVHGNSAAGTIHAPRGRRPGRIADMGCSACEDQTAYNSNTNQGFYYRWRNATIVIVGCREHAKEAMKALNYVQQHMDLVKEVIQQ